MIKLTKEDEAITSFKHFKFLGFILTMRNVNDNDVPGRAFMEHSFILTMRNVNFDSVNNAGKINAGFILTMRNVNKIIFRK